ncbi:hypothetical protein ACFP77_23020, partial [Shinella zoogloeoides]
SAPIGEGAVLAAAIAKGKVGCSSRSRLIKSATIDAGNYPLSRKARAQEQRAGVEVWENEGGSTAAWPRCPIV